MTSGAPIRSRTNASSSFLQGYEKPVLNQPGQGFVAQRQALPLPAEPPLATTACLC